MMEQHNLRKADIFSGSLIMLLGIFIIGQALQMPMKDSWGGVQNVWFVSPALFPLFVGAMLTFLGFVLICIAFKAVSTAGIKATFEYLLGESFRSYLLSTRNVRFYAVVLNLAVYVFLMVPRVDFFPASIQFLLTFFFMFYLSDARQLVKLLVYTIITNLILACLLFTDLATPFHQLSEYYGDWYVLLTTLLLILLARTFTTQVAEQKRKYRLCLLIGFIAPTVIGIIFKYFLLVPMPFEGLAVQLFDAIWYADFWS